MKYKLKILFSIAFIVVIIDQWTKSLATDYLRKPERGDFSSKCKIREKSCEELCLKSSEKQNNSFLFCQKNCKHYREKCEITADKKYKKAIKLWNYRQKAMLHSPLCYRVEFAGSSRPECVVIPNYFHFTYRINYGAAWGIFSDIEHEIRKPFFSIITTIAISFILYLFFFKISPSHKLMIFALSFILGGALGNFLDRISLGYVVDFIEWFYRDRRYTWPTFNIADVSISIGVTLIAIELLLFSRDPLSPKQKPSPYIYYPYLLQFLDPNKLNLTPEELKLIENALGTKFPPKRSEKNSEQSETPQYNEQSPTGQLQQVENPTPKQDIQADDSHPSRQTENNAANSENNSKEKGPSQ